MFGTTKSQLRHYDNGERPSELHATVHVSILEMRELVDRDRDFFLEFILLCMKSHPLLRRWTKNWGRRFQSLRNIHIG